jgi:hypothetical protein
VSRADLTDTYDISGVQASNDFQRYLAFNPGALQYDLRKKRYFWNPAAQPVLHRPDFGEAVRELLDAEPPAGGAPVAGSEAVRCRRLEYPVREAKLEIQRAFMGAILNGTVLAVRYLSVSSGDHEVREIAPAVAEARARGFQVAGPIGPDSVFHQAMTGRYTAVLALYHDQGHIATKTLDFDRTVSLTLGLPFLRVSVDHGTAFDIAWQGKVSAAGMVESLLVAARYASAYRQQRRSAARP